MFKFTHTVETKAPPEQIWRIWEDVENWKRWDKDIEYSEIDGPFQAGTKGTTKFFETPSFKTLLTEVKPHQLFIQEAYLSFAKVVSNHSMNHSNGVTEVTFRVEIQESSSSFHSQMIGRFIKKKLPLEMEEMLKIVEAYA
ncbi:MAG: hypothetical protein SP1CHLAM54_03780 [Chlamydiia bacterium]|nr:hypothetical protein [Chlamydiia bacterium]MCH9615294.1 hypothetical protein [Chlamydiia bacterium]MCH9628384.1 hypothetical protein [Chlamydiia bacterium]